MDAAFKTIMKECYYHPVPGPEALGPAVGTFRTVLTSYAAVAAAAVGAIAVMGPEGEQIGVMITNSQIRNYVTTQGHQWTYEALEYLRDYVGEKGGLGKPSMRAIELTTAHLGGGLSIPPMMIGGYEDMDYTVHHELPSRIVDCKAMIANLPKKTRNKLLGANHVCRMTLEWVPNSYDRKRRRAMAQKCSRWSGFPTHGLVPLWEYHLLLSDGSVVRFHTDWSRKVAFIRKITPVYIRLQPPLRDDKDERGSYRFCKYRNYYTTRQWKQNSRVVGHASLAVAAAESDFEAAAAFAVAKARVRSAVPKRRPPVLPDEQINDVCQTMASLGVKEDKKKESEQVPAPRRTTQCCIVRFYPCGRCVGTKRPGSSGHSSGTRAASEQTHGYGV